ncbi:hypothetical protein ACFQXA_04905 [Nocardiopsis composta]
MFTGYVISACLLAAIVGFSGAGKLAENEQVVASLTRAAVPMSWYRPWPRWSSPVPRAC